MILYDESAIFNVLITLRSSVRCCPCINSRWQQRVSFIYLYVWHVCGFCVFLMCQFQRFFLLTCPRKTRFKAHTHQKKNMRFVCFANRANEKPRWGHRLLSTDDMDQ